MISTGIPVGAKLLCGEFYHAAAMTNFTRKEETPKASHGYKAVKMKGSNLSLKPFLFLLVISFNFLIPNLNQKCI